jgi:hypothetical protein
MGLSLNPALVDNAINKLFTVNGRNPYASDKSNGFKTTQGVRRDFGDTFVSSAQLKNVINDPNAHVALSLRDNYHPGTAQDLAAFVAQGLDSADGSSNGLITVDDSSRYWGQSSISRDELAARMATGEVVLGEGGKLLSRAEAIADGDIIVAVHEDKAGPTLALDR